MLWYKILRDSYDQIQATEYTVQCTLYSIHIPYQKEFGSAFQKLVLFNNGIQPTGFELHISMRAKKYIFTIQSPEFTVY